jgi:hypothetical protein
MQTALPGVLQPIMLPVFVQWATTVVPSANCTSARNLM